MFWKWFGDDKKDKTVEGEVEDIIELPPLEELEQWVLSLIAALDLKPGTFTFLPAYGGVLLFIQHQGISWIPYDEIREALGRVDKSQLVESSAMVGGAAAVAAGTLALPTLLLPRLIKGSYRIIAKPSPKTSMSFLKSIIDEVIIEEKKMSKRLLDTFETLPFKENDGEEVPTAHVVTIYRKFLDKHKKESFTFRMIKGIVALITGSDDPVFAIPPQSDIKTFASILVKNDINVTYYQSQNGELEEKDIDLLSEPED